MTKKTLILCVLCGFWAIAPLHAQKKLSAVQARVEADKQIEAYQDSVHAAYGGMWENRLFVLDDLRMPILYKVYGEKPADGRSLYISMHGGGNAPTELNNQQWRNQIMLYTPAEGVYVAPRAPFDDWNMWFRPEMNDFFRMLIAAAVVEMEVNPDKVYLLGYSAGGDGVWRMAPRMADRWAAASMMAGHPGEAFQVNLLNLPFMIWMGEHDAAYNRNALAVEKGQVLDSLHAANPSGYIHETHIVSGKGHWMDRADTAAIAWMAQYRRNPYPAEVVWRQEDVVSPALYWLQVPEEEARPGMLLHVRREGNRIFIDHSDYAHVTLLLNDDMLDLDRPLTVEYKGKILFRGKVRRSADVITRTLAERQDPRLVFSAELPLTLP